MSRPKAESNKLSLTLSLPWRDRLTGDYRQFEAWLNLWTTTNYTQLPPLPVFQSLLHLEAHCEPDRSAGKPPATTLGPNWAIALPIGWVNCGRAVSKAAAAR